MELHAESGCSRIFSLTTSLITLVSFTDAPLRAEYGLASSSPAPKVRLPLSIVTVLEKVEVFTT